MPRQACPHYSNPTTTGGVSRCRACQQIIGVSPAAEVPPHGEVHGVPAGAGTGLAAMKAGSTTALDTKAQ